MSGVLLMSIGFLLASFGKSGLHPLLTQGFLAGMGMSLLYFPVLALAPEYFTNYRATTIGFILAGARAGSLFLSSLLRTILFPLLRTLLTTLGGRWSLRIYALLAVANTTNAVARIITGYVGDWLGKQNTLAMALSLAAGSVFSLWLGGVQLGQGQGSPNVDLGPVSGFTR